MPAALGRYPRVGGAETHRATSPPLPALPWDCPCHPPCAGSRLLMSYILFPVKNSLCQGEKGNREQVGLSLLQRESGHLGQSSPPRLGPGLQQPSEQLCCCTLLPAGRAMSSALQPKVGKGVMERLKDHGVTARQGHHGPSLLPQHSPVAGNSLVYGPQVFALCSRAVCVLGETCCPLQCWHREREGWPHAVRLYSCFRWSCLTPPY